MASGFKKHWSMAAAGLSGAAVLGLAVLLHDPAPDSENAPPRGDDITEPHAPEQPEEQTPYTTEAPDTDTPDTADTQTMNAADECIAAVVDKRIVPSYEVMAREYRSALTHGLYINPQREVTRIEAVTAREFAKCTAAMEPTEASGPARDRVETAREEFLDEFSHNYPPTR